MFLVVFYLYRYRKTLHKSYDYNLSCGFQEFNTPGISVLFLFFRNRKKITQNVRHPSGGDFIQNIRFLEGFTIKTILSMLARRRYEKV